MINLFNYLFYQIVTNSLIHPTFICQVLKIHHEFKNKNTVLTKQKVFEAYKVNEYINHNVINLITRI